MAFSDFDVDEVFAEAREGRGHRLLIGERLFDGLLDSGGRRRANGWGVAQHPSGRLVRNEERDPAIEWLRAESRRLKRLQAESDERRDARLRVLKCAAAEMSEQLGGVRVKSLAIFRERLLSDLLRLREQRRRTYFFTNKIDAEIAAKAKVAEEARRRIRRRLTDSQVVEIRSRYSAGVESGAKLARAFGVSHGAVWAIVTGSQRRAAGGPIYMPSSWAVMAQLREHLNGGVTL